MALLKTPLILIHFQSGGVQMALLKTPLLSGRKIEYVPKSILDDRRSVQRIPLIKDIKLDDLGTGRAWDMSSHGMYIETLTPYPINTRLPVKIELFDESIQLEAKVAFCDPGIGVGLEFCRMPIATRFKVEALIHQSSPHQSPKSTQDRRNRSERRKQKLPSTAKVIFPKWKSRKTERRDLREFKDSPSVETKLSEIKVIFFLDNDFNGNSTYLNSPPGKEPIILEFRDGEQIQGMLHESSQETMGFFLDIQLTPGNQYTVFVIKSAIKSIKHLL